MSIRHNTARPRTLKLHLFSEFLIVDISALSFRVLHVFHVIMRGFSQINIKHRAAFFSKSNQKEFPELTGYMCYTHYSFQLFKK